jgi:N4-gp56 family major capsid protein
MAYPLSTKTQVPNVNHFYVRDFLDRARENLVHDAFGQMKPIPQNNSDLIYFRRYERLAKNYTPLGDGVTPAGKQLSVTTIYATVEDYGDYVMITDKVLRETEDAIWAEVSDVLVEQANDSLDCVTREKLMLGTNVVYAGSGNTDTDEVAALDVPTYANLKSISLLLRNANAKKITEFVRPDQGYNTTPVRPCYVGITSPAAIEKFKALESGAVWEDAEKYANMSNLLPEEQGRIGDIRFVETTNAKVKEGAGTSGIDVYTLLVIGKNAYGVTLMDGMSTNIYIKLPSEAGAEDPIEQRASAGWKVSKTAKILNEDWMVRYEFAIA